MLKKLGLFFILSIMASSGLILFSATSPPDSDDNMEIMMPIVEAAIAAGPQHGSNVFYAYSEYSDNSLHQIGAPASETSWAISTSSAGGFLTYGPYTAQFQNGFYTATFSLRVNNITADNNSIGYVDVFDSVSNTVLAHQEFHRQEFSQPMVFQNISTSFYTSGPNNLQFRVYYNASADAYPYLEHAQTTISLVSAYTSQDLFYYASDPRNGHGIGYANGNNWDTTGSYGAGFMTFGPYATNVPSGNSTATFTLLIDNNSADDNTVVRIEAYDTSTGQVLAYRIINRMDFSAPMKAQDFDLVFELASAPSTMEFRVYAYGISYIEHQKTVIRPDRLNLDSLYNSNSHFEYRTRDEFSSNLGWDGNTSTLVTLDGIWYAFNRNIITVSGCSNSTGLQTVVRMSTDRGITWSNPVVVASPNGSGPDGCIVTDGGVYFDAETDTWQMLYQCLAKNSSTWDLCHYTKSGISPMGRFTPDSANPVVKSGQLWSQICGGSGKSCPSQMNSEGTAQIVEKVNGLFYVTFHGAYSKSSSVVIGARGVATTSDFVHWQVSGNGLPDNAILSSQDCASWNVNWLTGGCIGTGNARMIRSGGYNYILAEAADLSLGCTVNQHWVDGLLRSTSWAPSGGWQNDSVNPLIVDLNVSTVGCALQYQNIFRDRGDLFLTFGFFSPSYAFPNYTYELVNGHGPAQVLAQ